MSQIYTPVATSHGSYTLPSDGDPAVAESVNDAFRDLADNTLVALNNAAAALALAGQMINGVTGGTYAPTDDVIFENGHGIILDGPDADLEVRGDSRINVSGAMAVTVNNFLLLVPASFEGTSVTFSEDTTVTFNGPAIADDLTVETSFVANGDVTLGDSSADTITIDGSLVVNSPTEFEDVVAFATTTIVEGLARLDGDVRLGSSASDTITLNSIMAYGTAGRVPYKMGVLLSASSTVNITDGEVFIIDYTVAVGTLSINLSSSGAQGGDKMVFGSFTANGLSSAVNINGNETRSFSAGDDAVFAEFIFLEGVSGFVDGWYPLMRGEL